LGDGQSKLPRGLRVDDKSKGDRLAEGEVCYCRALEDTIYVAGEPASLIVKIDIICGEAAHSHRRLTQREERGQFFFRGEGDDRPVKCNVIIACLEESTDLFLGRGMYRPAILLSPQRLFRLHPR
jgi:hypothetical protein